MQGAWFVKKGSGQFVCYVSAMVRNLYAFIGNKDYIIEFSECEMWNMIKFGVFIFSNREKANAEH